MVIVKENGFFFLAPFSDRYVNLIKKKKVFAMSPLNSRADETDYFEPCGRVNVYGSYVRKIWGN